MIINVLYFASIREQTGIASETINIQEEYYTLKDLKKFLLEKYPSLSLDRVNFAINKTYSSLDTELKENDTVALIPPISGG